MQSPNVDREKKLLENIEKIQKKQLEVNSRLVKNYTPKDDKLNAILSKSINDMQKKLAISLQNNNKAILKDFNIGLNKNINHAFGEQADSIINVLESQKNHIKDMSKPQPLPKVFLNKLSNANEESIDYFKNSVKDVFESVTDSLKGHFNSIFGPIYDSLVAPLISVGKSMFEFGKSTLGLFGGNKEDENAKITANTLLWIKDFYEDERKRDLRTGDKKEKGLSWLGFLGVVVMTLGGLVGGLIRRFTLFFEIFQIQKLGMVKKVISFFAILGKSIGGWLDDAIRTVGKIPLVGKFISLVLNQFMKFFPAVAKGFKLLGWPLVVLMGAIDFIRGFLSSEGNILDRIQGGIDKAITGFIELPVKLLGFIGDKILSLFGVEIEGGIGDKMKSYILGMTDIFMMPLRMIEDFFTGFFNSEEDVILGRLKDGLFGVFDGLLSGFENIFNFVGNLFDFDNLKNSLLDKVRKIPGSGWFIKSGGDKEQAKNIISGGRGRTPGSSIGSTYSKSLSGGKDNTKPAYNEILGIGTQLTDVPNATGEWEDPMGSSKRITSEFGGRIHPITGKMQGHKGLDMAGPEPGMYGYPIKASRDGLVSIAGNLRGYGNVVYIDHDDGYQTRYAHLQNYKVRPGETVFAGQVIGGMGNTGVGTGPHLHYEVRKNGKPLNPKQVLSARDGAYIGNQSSEMGIPAEVHPNEAILPLNDTILGILGKKISGFIKGVDISDNKLSSSNYDNILSDNGYEYMSRLNNNAITKQKEMNSSFLNNLRQLIGDLKDSQQNSTESIANNMNNFIDNSRSMINDNEPPDQIENGLLLIMNSGWGVS